MKPLNVVYIIRGCLGVAAAVLCAALLPGSKANLMGGLWMALTVYIFTYYIIRQLFIEKVKEARSVATMGIGAYFLTWIVTWVLLLSIQLSGG